MASYPNQDPPVVPLNVKINDIIKGGNFSQIQSSTDYTLRSGPGGTHINHFEAKQVGLSWQGTYDFSGSYTTNQVVMVEANTGYVDEFGDTYTAEEGSWVCIASVPHYYTATDSAAIEAADVPGDVLDYWLRQEGTDYTPNVDSDYWEKIGGGGGSGSINYSLYNYSASYHVNVFVAVNKPTIRYTDGSSSVWAYPGVYICTQDVVALSGSLATGGSRGSTFQMPYYPGSAYWDLFSFAPEEVEMCGGKTFFLNATEKEPATASVIHI